MYPVLVVCDEMDLFVTELQGALQRAGAESIVARTPADALANLKRFDFAAIVISYVPGFDPDYRELMREIGGVPALFLAAPSTPLSTFGIVPILFKPISADAVVRAVERLLGRDP